MTRKLFMLAAVLMMMFAMFSISGAAPLADNCTKVQGTVTCTTYTPSPGNNQAGLGTTVEAETQGNVTNVAPVPQDLDTTSSCKPPKSQGTPCG